MFKFNLGEKLRCVVTGAEGIAIARVQYLNGCIQYGLKRLADKDGKTSDADYFDEGQLQFVDPGLSKSKSGAAGLSVVTENAVAGGPSSDAPPPSYTV